MTDPIETYLLINQELRDGVSSARIIATSKGHPLDEMDALYATGCRCFGESRVQELLKKIDHFPDDIEWHLIGSLQRNKVRQVVGKVALIHSVDSLALAEKLSQVSGELGVITRILIQLNSSGEPTKHGLSFSDCAAQFDQFLALPYLEIAGLMTMAPNSEDQDGVRGCFRQTAELRDRLQLQYSIDLPELSMGMSRDYRIAVEEGATLLRIGTRIFGKRHE